MCLPGNNAALRRWGVLVAAATVLLCGCSRVRNESYVARVDQSILTKAELPSVHDSTHDARRQNLEFVDNWIAGELLYQEAVRRGLSDTEVIRRQVQAARKRLAINALLDQELFAKGSTLVTEQAMHDLYSSGGDELRLKEDVALVSTALFSDRDAANDFRSRVLRGASWQDALHHIERDSLLRPTLLQVVDRQYVTQSTFYPEELWRLALTLNKEEVSFVVATTAGFYVLIVHGVKHKGEMPDWDFIKDELRERILIDQRRSLYDSLLTALRTKHTVEIRIEAPDSSAAHE